MSKFLMLQNYWVVFYSEPFHHQQWEFLQFEVDDQGQNDSRDQDLVSNDTTTMLSMLNCLLWEVHIRPILKKYFISMSIFSLWYDGLFWFITKFIPRKSSKFKLWQRFSEKTCSNFLLFWEEHHNQAICGLFQKFFPNKNAQVVWIRINHK